MRALLQRVTRASVTCRDDETDDWRETGAIGPGFCILLGVGPEDTPETAERLWRKVRNLRVFDDDEGHMNRSLIDVGGAALVVSQFTLYADARKGNRPSFTGAAKPDVAIPLYERFCALARQDVPVGTGIFGAEMRVSLTNDGPVTIWLDTDELTRSKQ
ncbi:D-aminoacyl-tRNA deacylase [Olsenella sp. YH-ols2217]|uniref:D-aminoacyl-tRNA deacylase n=1 Tax=Kribbibacterium absianum TaxID=3044210 RepID=A0ABT6ZMQ1_9ACTN|nr:MULTISPECIES: D-aminoacyl-tRNA deacylase [unclassified Olsenella]MDJ1122243.1 D-aminoacyl-tRNA deacylase [Olsenella sp. YH-ols2216]MDJ1130343.1 D-aminoacyl-tRNA deacylase [Olsenella sp. YH-ols2217]